MMIRCPVDCPRWLIVLVHDKPADVRVQLAPELGDLPVHTLSLQDAHNLATSQVLDQTDAMRVTEDNANLRGRHTLLGKLANQVLSLVRRGLQPSRSATAVGNGGARDALSGSVHATHLG